MAQRVFGFVVVLLLFFSGKIFSQKISTGLSFSWGYGRFQDFGFPLNSTRHTASKKVFQEAATGAPGIPSMPAFSLLNQSISTIGSDYYCNHLGIICRKEWQFEKQTGIPLRVRLGSLDYVNYLEQKPNAGYIH